MTGHPSTLERLKERKLVQWGVAYLAGAWVLLQVLDQLSDTYRWPSVILRVITAVVGVGFFGALVLAWYHGEKGQQRVSGPELLMLSALLVVAGGVVWVMGSDLRGATRVTHRPEPRTLSAAQNLAPHRSIAVLPFADLSEKKDQEYFSDGMTEELLNALTDVEGLKVAARTSSFAFKGKNVPVGEIARQLGVAHILEGSVRKSGNRLRINAQLVDSRTGYHLWSDAYDRELQDVFAIQEEISRAIVDALRIQLAGRGSSSLADQGTEDLRAYDLYLKGRYAWNQRTFTQLFEAARYFEQAVERDPEFARAYAGLADAYVLLPVYGNFPPGTAWSRVQDAAEKALSIDSTLAEAHATLAYGKMLYEWDWQGAEEGFRRAIKLNPNYATAHQWYGNYLGGRGRLEEALRELKRAHELDPLSPILAVEVGWALYFLRRYDEAEAHLKQVLRLHPTFGSAHRALAVVYLAKRMPVPAIAESKRAIDLAGRQSVDVASLAYAHSVAGNQNEAKQLLGELLARSRGEYIPPTHVALAYIGLGDRTRAFEWLNRGVDERDGILAENGLSEPLMDPLRSDPRYSKLLKRMGMQE